MRSTGNGELIRLSIATQEGPFLAEYSARGLAQLHFPTALTANPWPATGRTSPVVRSWHRATTAALKSILGGRAPRSLPPLDFSAGSVFQQSVWRALEGISFGQTHSYGEIARAIGKPKAVRAVGGACGANPIPVLVPCHRVLAANKKIGGFSGGLDWKRILLEREGVKLH